MAVTYGPAIQTFIVDELLGGDVPDGMTNSTRLVEEAILDSLGIFEMVAWIEESHSVDIDPEEITIDNFKTIEQIDEFIKAKVA